MSAAAFAVPLMMSVPVRSDDMTESRLLWHLTNWEQWQLRSNWKVERGYPQRASGRFNSSYAYGDTFDEKADREEARLAAVVDSIVNEIPPAQSAAVKYTHGIAAVFRLRGSIEQHYLEAKRSIRAALMRKGIT